MIYSKRTSTFGTSFQQQQTKKQKILIKLPLTLTQQKTIVTVQSASHVSTKTGARATRHVIQPHFL